MTANTIITTTKTKIIEIHIGLNIHHHDHVILPNNFKTMKTKVNSPVNPIPLVELFC